MGTNEISNSRLRTEDHRVVLETNLNPSGDSSQLNKTINEKEIWQNDSPVSAIDTFLERVLVWAQARYGDDELVRAKEEFFWKMGKVFHDDPFYDQRMNYFLDYFILERPLSIETGKLTPLAAYAEQAEEKLKGFVHSVFQILKISTNNLYVQDLISGKKIHVHARNNESFAAMNRKELVQGFLYESHFKTLLSHGTLYHPMKSVRIIKKEIKHLKSKDDFDRLRELSKLARQNLKYLRHAHVDPKRIYGTPSA